MSSRPMMSTVSRICSVMMLPLWWWPWMGWTAEIDRSAVRTGVDVEAEPRGHAQGPDAGQDEQPHEAPDVGRRR